MDRKKNSRIKNRSLYRYIVVSDDHDERDTTLGYGAILRDCHMFIKELKDRKQSVSKNNKKSQFSWIKKIDISAWVTMIEEN